MSTYPLNSSTSRFFNLSLCVCERSSSKSIALIFACACALISSAFPSNPSVSISRNLALSSDRRVSALVIASICCISACLANLTALSCFSCSLLKPSRFRAAFV